MRRLALLSLLLAGCTVGPNYRPPETAAPARFAGPQPAVANPVDVARWWQVFRDPVLDDLVARALKDSPDIATAASRVRQARLGEIIAGAANKPTLDATAGASHIEFSKNAGFANLAQAFGGGGGTGGGTGGGGAGGGTGSGGQQGGGIALPGSGITTYSVGLDASWELDLFGGGRRQVEAARARTESAIWNGRDAAVTLASEVATTYFQLRLDQVQIAVIEGELLRQRRALDIAGNQSKVGLVPGVDVTRQRGTITATEARLQPIRADIEIQIHALGVLLGQQPGALGTLRQPAAVSAAVPLVPAGLPADLLRRRPDVRAAERDLAAATADIGVAVADLYPKLTLTGMEEFISSALHNLFSGDSLQLTASGNAMFPLIDWGRRKATVGQREEAREQAYQTWRGTVLGALRDVEDPLSQLDGERRRNAALARAVADQQASRDAIAAQYRTGFVAQDSLLNAEADVLSSREQLAASDTQLRRYTVALFKALGGGWESAEPTPTR